MAFLLIMVATGWVGPEHMAEERVHFSREFIFQREGEFKREEFLKEQLENFRGRGEVCPGYLTSAF